MSTRPPAAATAATAARSAWVARRPSGAADLVLRVAVSAALLVSAVVHLRLAGGYALAFPGGLGGGTMFRLEAVAALAAVVPVLWWGGARGHLPALVVLTAAFAAVVLYRYVPVPSIGPVPSMYEPVWYAEKTLAAIAAGAGAVLAAVGATTMASSRARRDRRRQR